MNASRRYLLAEGAAFAAALVLLSPSNAAAQGAAADPRMADRFIGNADAPVTAIEFSSLTCPHCAAFSRDTLPQLRTQLIDTGRLRMVFRPFPLDQVALTAEMVARALPPDRYEPFCEALFASQDRWAYARGANTTEELAKMSALAGLPRATFDATIADKSLRDAILAQQEASAKTYQIDSTPSFIFNGPGLKDRKVAGEQNFADFAKLVAQAAGA